MTTFTLYIYSELEKLNPVDRHGVTQRCIGTCRMVGRLSFDDQPAKKQKARTQTHKHYKSKRHKLCPNSGATSHMFTHEGDFGDDYRRCKDVFVYMVTAPVSLWLAMVLLVSS